MKESNFSGVHVYQSSPDKRAGVQKEIWDGVYRDKEKDLNVHTPYEFNPSPKHIMYCNSFHDLGFFDRFPASPKILQAGVGHGKTLRTMMEYVTGSVPIGLDISYLALQRTINNGINPLVQADILHLPFEDESIDAAFEVGVVEHLYTNDPFGDNVVDRKAIVDSFLELNRVLKSDGKVGFIQPSIHSALGISNSLDNLRGSWLMGFQEDFSISEFCQLMSIAGFNDIQYCVLQAPEDFNLPVKIGDRLLKTYYSATGQYKKAELTGALFSVVGTKK